MPDDSKRGIKGADDNKGVVRVRAGCEEIGQVGARRWVQGARLRGWWRRMPVGGIWVRGAG